MPILLHLTDLHLYADAQGCLKTVNTRDSFAAVLAKARQSHPHPDALILGGDLAQDESPVAYRALGTMLADWRVPRLITPGNHDSLAAIARIFAPLPDHLDLGSWRIVALNTHEDGKDGGRLAKAALARLHLLLNDAGDHRVLICMHHPPVTIGSAWMDEIGLVHAESFWSVVERFDCVRGVLFGHVHQALDGVQDGIRLLGSPSTCIQFKPLQDRFWLDGQSPGYRWLELHPDGDITTGVVRIAGFIPEDLSDNAEY